MAKLATIVFGVITLIGRISSTAEYDIDEQIASQSTSLLQVGTFHIGENEKEKPFFTKPLAQESWGRDEEEEDAEDESGDADSEGISQLQLSSERAGQHEIQYPQASPTMVRSPGSAPMENAMPGTLRQAVVQSISQIAPTTPRAPLAGLVSTSALAAHEGTSGADRAAFSQLSALEAEFKELREDDSSHVNQLMYTVHLREQLRDQLRTAQEQLEKDNQELAERTSEIIVAGHQDSAAASSKAADPDGPPGQAEEATNTTVAAMLLQDAISSRQHRELNNQQIAKESLDRVQALMNDIAALRKRDEEEMQALRTNADSREALRTKIDKRREQLQTDAGALLEDLSQIRGLVQHESEVQGDQAVQVGPDTQEGPKVSSDNQVPTAGQQPIAVSQEQINMLQQQQQPR